MAHRARLLVAQLSGGVIGVWITHVMFELPVLQLGQHARTGLGQWVAEGVTTFGLLAVIWGCRAHRGPVAAFAVAAYVTGAADPQLPLALKISRERRLA